MGVDLEWAKRAEKKARQLAREAGMPESLWEAFLMAAYDALREEDAQR